MTRSAILLALTLLASTAQAQGVDAARVLAHETALTAPAMRGRGSLTPDEARAAAYVAEQFKAFGLKTAPGMDGYTQSIPVMRQRLTAGPVLSIDGKPVAGAFVLSGEAGAFGGTVAVIGQGTVGKADVLVAPADADRAAIAQAVSASGARVVLRADSPGLRRGYEAGGGRPRLPAYFPDETPPPPRTAQVGVPAAALKAAMRPGARVSLSIPATLERAATTNAVAYLPGTDPAAGVILLSAHLDHLGVGLDGQVFAGANDDASGVTALLEFARLLAAGAPPRRGVLFVAYGAEEAGGFGARWFGDHSPVPLERIKANLEFEMLGARVPKLAADRLQMTGFERSNLGEALKAHGALIDADPYPEENYFQRSDNYALALRGVVAHTLSGYGDPPTYHSPTDTIGKLDLDFMTRAIGSLVGPIRWLVDGDFEPGWNPGQRPTP